METEQVISVSELIVISTLFIHSKIDRQCLTALSLSLTHPGFDDTRTLITETIVG